MSTSMPVATNAATNSGRRAAAQAANVAPKENPVTNVFAPNRSRSNSNSATVSSTIRPTLISNRFEPRRSYGRRESSAPLVPVDDREVLFQPEIALEALRVADHREAGTLL